MPRPAPSAAATAPTSLYVHVPFCVVKCGYCDFNSYVVEDRSVHDTFLEALERELAASWRGAPPVSVFIGGGTPSLLDPARLERLLQILARHVDLKDAPEVSMEANPESLTEEKAAIARAHGVRRLSMGVQSFHPHHLRFLDRAHSGERAEQAFAEARAAGFDNLSVDMMFGLPGETFDEWRADLERAIALRPDHVSAYNLTFEPGTRLHRDMQRGEVEPNEQEVDRAMFEFTRSRLAEAGFDAYEISNFAGPGGPCRHNDHYWLQGDYVGIGPGASSHRQGVRTTNSKPIESWAKAALAGLPPSASAETLRPRQRAAEALWLGIRRRDGVDVAAVEARLDLPVREWFGALLDEQQRQGLVRWDGACLRLTGDGLLVADRVGGEYLAIGVDR
ncbi:MAG: radical SAM family heme chaperone HemW [Planctomycetes bacterium]|nr:radical SAM family heme chaperone HemW [Planctomycetota bacterium]